MNPSEYLDAAKAKMGVESDYELAKRFCIPKQYVSAYRIGKRSIDNMTIFKIADTLGLDPAGVVADLESQREKNEKRREYWQKKANVFLKEIERMRPALAPSVAMLEMRTPETTTAPEATPEPSESGWWPIAESNHGHADFQSVLNLANDSGQIRVYGLGVFQIDGWREMRVTPDHASGFPAAHLLNRIERHAFLN